MVGVGVMNLGSLDGSMYIQGLGVMVDRLGH